MLPGVVPKFRRYFPTTCRTSQERKRRGTERGRISTLPPVRSADFPVRSNSQNIERFEGSVAASEFERCCGLESPRSVRLQGFHHPRRGLHRLVNVGSGVRGGKEPGLELGGREINAFGQ